MRAGAPLGPTRGGKGAEGEADPALGPTKGGKSLAEGVGKKDGTLELDRSEGVKRASVSCCPGALTREAIGRTGTGTEHEADASPGIKGAPLHICCLLFPRLSATCQVPDEEAGCC